MNFYFIDLDGTIEDSRLDMANCVNLVREKFSLPRSNVDEIQKYVTKGMDELYRSCFSEVLSDLEKVRQEYENCYFINSCVYTKCYDGIPEAIKKLSQSGKIIVVTNKPEKISRELLKQLDLIDFITDVMGGDSCSECKPSPLPLQIAARRHGFVTGSHSAYMIGDSLGDVQAAYAFGAKAVWCSWGYLNKLENISADIVLDHPSQLENLA